MAGERDQYGRLIDDFERASEAMLNLYTMLDELSLAGFPQELVHQLADLRLQFLKQFDARFPGKGMEPWWISQR